MAIERKLSKTQLRVFIGLAQQRQELQEVLQEILDAEEEQLEALRVRFGLPEGKYALRQASKDEVLFVERLESAEAVQDKVPEDISAES